MKNRIGKRREGLTNYKFIVNNYLMCTVLEREKKSILSTSVASLWAPRFKRVCDKPE